MKITLAFIGMLAFAGVYAQDTLKIKQIDAIVSGINTSALPSQQDSIIQDRPEMGLKMTTYLTMIVKGDELIKYVNHGITTMIENGITRQIISSNIFYYNHNRLIKVEEYLIEADQKKTADWYYSDDTPLYYTLQSDKAADRANLLLTLSNAMLKQIIK